MYNYWAWRLIPTCGKIPLHLYVTVSFHSNWVAQPLTLPASPATAVIYLLPLLPGHFLLAFLPQWFCLTSNLFPLFLRGWLFLCVLHSLPRSSEHIAIWRCPQTQTFPQGKPSRLQFQCKTANIRVFFEAVLHFEPFKKQRWNRQSSWTIQGGRKCQGTER